MGVLDSLSVHRQVKPLSSLSLDVIFVAGEATCATPAEQGKGWLWQG